VKKVQFIVLMIVCLLILPKPVLAEKFEISGVLEAESFYSSTDLAAGGDTNASDITTATAELAVGMNLHQYVHGQINLKWEEDDTDPLQFDVGTMTLGKLDGLSVTVGKAYLPFGAFNSHFVSDPITLQLGETRESPFIIAYNQDIFTVKAGAFNGDVKKIGDDTLVDDYVVAIEVTPVEGIILGASYISDMADTDADLLSGSNFIDEVGGFSAFVSTTFGPLTVEAEYLGALDDFASSDLDGDSDGNGDQPRAWNVEAAYGVTDKLEAAIKYEGNDEFFTSPKDQYGVAASYQIWDGVSASLEYLHGNYDNSSTNDNIDIATLKLAAEF
jgi:predicted porin|tara:strand:- start:531 stop:1520 length:990 start_codon:yes stop_codon:yes gene_type:complete